MRCIALLALVLAAFPTHAQSGTFDPTFGTGGQVTLVQGADPFLGASAVVARPDGRLLVAGRRDGAVAVFALSVTGALDATFGTDGVASAQVGGMSRYADETPDLTVLADGRIAVSATRTFEGDSEAGVLTAFTATGQRDAAFGTNGQVVVPGTIGLSSLGADASGRIVAVGYATGSTGVPVVVVTRLLPTGTVDATFGTNGQTQVAFGTANGPFPARATVLPDSRVLVAGAELSSTGGSLRSQPFVVRLTSAGVLDAAFGTSGIARVPLTGTQFNGFSDVATDAAGRIVAVGSAINGQDVGSVLVARLTDAGTLDATFGSGGTVLTRLGTTSATGNALHIQPDGKILLAAAVGPDETSQIGIARLTAAGALDATFGVAGVVAVPSPAGTSEIGTDLALQSDGRIVVVGLRDEFGRSVAVRAVRLMGDAGTPGEPEAIDAVLRVAIVGANPSVVPRVTLGGSALPTRVTVWDALGRQVAVLSDGAADGATLALPAGLAPGVYVVRAESGRAQASVRLVQL